MNSDEQQGMWGQFSCCTAGQKFYGYNREDFAFFHPPGVEQFVQSPENVLYCRLRLVFMLAFQIDGQVEPVKVACAYLSFCYEIKLESSGM